MSTRAVHPLGQGRPATMEQSRLWLFRAVAAAACFGGLHHLDHVIRGNHVGWPLSAEVNAFSYSLGVYPLVLIGVIARWRGRLWPGYWLGIALLGLLTSGPTHLGPWAVEPVADIYTPYADPLFYCQTTAPASRVAFFGELYAPLASPLWGLLAVAVMLGLLAALVLLALTALWVARRTGRWWW